MKLKQYKTETISRDQIQPFERNPRRIEDKNLKALKSSLEEFGLVDPLVWNKRSGNLVSGHQRLKVLDKSKAKNIECIVVDITLEKEKALNIAMNSNTLTGEFDEIQLGTLLDEIQAEDELLYESLLLDELRPLELEDDEEEFEGETDPDEIPEEVEPITKPGDLWILGKHRVLCGDSTKEADVARLMGKQKADMVFTDPPYNVEVKGKFTGKIENDSMSDVDYKEFLSCIADVISENNNGSVYIFYEIKKHSQVADVFMSLDEITEIIIWNKDSASFYSNNVYNRKYEAMLFIKSKGILNCEAETNMWDYPKSSSFNSNDENNKKFNEPGNYLVAHPTTKPTKLIERAINNSSKPGDIVWDGFLGSGSTLIACEQTNRKCYGLELDPHYCDVIVKRWEDFTGNKAVLET